MIKRNTNVKDQRASRRLIFIAAAVLVGGGLVCWGLIFVFGALRGIWLEQFRVQDTAIDVVITSSGKNVTPGTISFQFDLTNGVNLATIPYDELRRSLIARIPNIHDISIERRLPRRVTVDVKEREPAVRIAPPKGASDSGLVADYDGVVFRTYNSPRLPIIRESSEIRHTAGHRLEGHARAALQLVHLLAEVADGKSDAPPALADLRVLELDTSKKDYLLVTLGDYSTAEIAWDHMGEDSEIAHQSLRRQLVHLAQAIATRLTPRATRWIATEYEKGGRVYAADPARLGER
jgi:cell division septal protein FtsQ